MNIPLDKQAHFMGGYIIAREVGQFNPLAGLIAACSAGWAKETYDKRHPENHTADRFDLFATILGGIADGIAAANRKSSKFHTAGPMAVVSA